MNMGGAFASIASEVNANRLDGAINGAGSSGISPGTAEAY